MNTEVRDTPLTPYQAIAFLRSVANSGERLSSDDNAMLDAVMAQMREATASPAPDRGLDGIWAEAMDWATAKGALFYEVKRRWEGGVKDGWCAMAIRDGWFWRECGDTPEDAIRALMVSDGRVSETTGWAEGSREGR